MKLIFKTLISFNLLFLVCCKKSTNEESTNQDTTIKNSKIEISRTERIKRFKFRVDSVNYSLKWKKTNFDLWKSKNGDLGLKTQEAIVDNYILQLADGRPLTQVIDTLTFEYLGSSFYKDKNHIYTHFKMADGGNFWIVENADVLTFKIIGDCYAKDKNHIFGERAMIMDSVDYNTFKTKKGIGCFAKDKNGYYFWDEKFWDSKKVLPKSKNSYDSLTESKMIELDKIKN